MKRVIDINRFIGVVLLFMGGSVAYWDISSFINSGGALRTNWVLYLLSGLYLLCRKRIISRPKLEWLAVGTLLVFFLIAILSDVNVIPSLEMEWGYAVILNGLLVMDLSDIASLRKGEKHAKN